MSKLIYVFNVPAHGHVNPSLPVMAELVRRGHRVVYFNAASFESLITSTGAEFRPYPDGGVSEAEFHNRSANLVNVTLFTMEESLRLLPFLLGEIEREKPDLAVFDSIALWGMLAARLTKLQSAASITTAVHDGVPGLLTWRDTLGIIWRSASRLPALQRLRRQLTRQYGPGLFPGSAILPCRGDVNIVYTSRAFQPDTPYIDTSFHFVGPSLLAGTRREVDFPWEALDPARNKIYVSLGTIYSGGPDFYRIVFAALAGHSAQVILSTGRMTNLESLGRIPANFLVRASVPQVELLQKVDLFITHGGMNSVNESLASGVPMVVVPQQIEQALNGRQVARARAGVVLGDSPPYGRIGAAALRRAVDTVLSYGRYRSAAGRLKQSFEQSGGYQRAADVIAAQLDP